MRPADLQFARAGADTVWDHMRTLGFRTHVMLVVAAALGVLAALGLPWYDRAPARDTAAAAFGDGSGPLQSLVQGLQRWATATGGTTGWTALGGWGTALAVLSLAAALAAVGCATPTLQGIAREVVRYAALGVFAIAAWRLLDPPGANAAVELRHGAFGGAVCAATLAMSAIAVANAPLRRRVEQPRYVAPPPPAAYDPAARSSVRPPGS